LKTVIAPGVVGNTSLKLMPLTDPGLAAGLVMVKVKVVLPPDAMLATPKALLIVGGVYTETLVMFEVAPVTAAGPVIETVLVMLFLTPAVVPVTVVPITQFAPPVKVPPVKVSRLLPVMVNMPPQVAVVPLAAVKPAGSVSVKAMPLIDVALLVLVTVMFKVVVPPTAMLAATNALAMVGAVTTVNIAVFEVAPVNVTGPVAAIAVLVLL